MRKQRAILISKPYSSSDEKINATRNPSDMRTSEAARTSPSPLLLSTKEIVNATPLPPAIAARSKVNMDARFCASHRTESQTGIIRRTPPPIHPSRVAASIQVPGPAVLVESQPQTPRYCTYPSTLPNKPNCCICREGPGSSPIDLRQTGYSKGRRSAFVGKRYVKT